MFSLFTAEALIIYGFSLLCVLWHKQKAQAKNISLYQYSRTMSSRKIRSSIFRNLSALIFSSLIWDYGGEPLLLSFLVLEFLLLKNELNYIHFYKKRAKKVMVFELVVYIGLALSLSALAKPHFSFYIILSAFGIIGLQLFNARIFAEKMLAEYQVLLKAQFLGMEQSNKQHNVLKIITKYAYASQASCLVAADQEPPSSRVA